MLDYIVVGLGLAGTAFCETLRQNNKEFIVFNDNSQTSSYVAGGLSNPVLLKRFTLAWNAQELMPIANAFYSELEGKLSININYDISVVRRLNSIEEQNSWFQAADKPSLKKFISTELIRNENKNIDAPFHLGEVLYVTRLDTKLLLNTYTNLLLSNKQLIRASFQHDQLEVKDSYVVYKGIEAKKIVFAEGYGLTSNPYFNYLPLQGSKGEYIIIKTDKLQVKNAVKSSIFIIPLGGGLYKVGANYERWDKTNLPTLKAKEELLQKLDAVVGCSYEIVGHEAGVRPTVSDRRPLLGSHPIHPMLSVLNGFGSHGVMIAPWASEHLYQYLETGKKLDQDVAIKRFKDKLKA